MAEPAGGPPEPPTQLLQMRRGTVGQGGIGLAPDMLSGVEFRRVRWKVVGMEPGMSLQIALDLSPGVNGAAVPQQHHSPAQRPQQSLEERADIQAGERPVSGQAEVEAQMAVLG